MTRRTKNTCFLTFSCDHCTLRDFSVAKGWKKAFDFPLGFGSLQVMDVCTSVPSCSHALPHLLFPHKNSSWWRWEASEGWAWGRAEGPPCSVCFKPLFGEETFIAAVIYEGAGFPRELASFPACNNPLLNIKPPSFSFVLCLSTGKGVRSGVWFSRGITGGPEDPAEAPLDR